MGMTDDLFTEIGDTKGTFHAKMDIIKDRNGTDLTEALAKSLWLCQSVDCVNHNKLWKILKQMGISDHLTHLLRNLYAGQEATVRTGHGTTDWFQIGKGVCQGCILSSCLFNLYAEYIMKNAGLDEAQTGTKIQFSSVAQSCPTLCHPMNHSTSGLPVHHHLPEFTQTNIHRIRDAIQPSQAWKWKL